jgi:hypothetical protein
MGSMMCTCSLEQPTLRRGVAITTSKPRQRGRRNLQQQLQKQQLLRRNLDSSSNVPPNSGHFDEIMQSPPHLSDKRAEDDQSEKVITVPRGHGGRGGKSSVTNTISKPTTHIALPLEVAPMVDSFGSASHTSSLNIRASIRVVVAPPPPPALAAVPFPQAHTGDQVRGSKVAANPLALQSLQPVKSTPTNLSPTMDPESSMELHIHTSEPQPTASSAQRSSAFPSGIMSSSGITILPFGRSSGVMRHQRTATHHIHADHEDEDGRGAAALLMNDVDSPTG